MISQLTDPDKGLAFRILVDQEINDTDLPSQFITALAADAAGSIWVGTDQGMAQYDGNSWTVPARMEEEFITRILFDEERNILWVGTENGLCSHDGSQWRKYNDPDSGLLDFYISSLL